MAGDITQVHISFNIGPLPKLLRHPIEVNAEAACQIDKGTLIFRHLGISGFRDFGITTFRDSEIPRNNHCLVPRRLLTGALLHIQMGRIDDAVNGSPRGQFPPCRLPAGNLLQGKRHIHLCRLPPTQGKSSDIIHTMLLYILPCRLVDFHACKDTKKNLHSSQTSVKITGSTFLTKDFQKQCRTHIRNPLRRYCRQCRYLTGGETQSYQQTDISL